MRCIYLIVFSSTNLAYIGKTKHFEIRKRGHLSMLRKQKHRNTILQSAFNKYGEADMRFYNIYPCSEEQEDELETQCPLCH